MGHNVQTWITTNYLLAFQRTNYQNLAMHHVQTNHVDEKYVTDWREVFC